MRRTRFRRPAFSMCLKFLTTRVGSHIVVGYTKHRWLHEHKFGRDTFSPCHFLVYFAAAVFSDARAPASTFIKL